MGRISKVSKAFLGTILFIGLIWFLFVGILANQPTKRTKTTVRSNSNLKLLKLIETRRHDVHWNSDINYVSKRRVPSGPDPIHNRGAGKSREPPSRA